MLPKLSKFLLVSLALIATPTFADAPACFTYDCPDQTCTFEASCTTTSPVWRVWYDFGDGGTSSYAGLGTEVSHTYLEHSEGGPFYPVVKLTVIPWSGPILTVSCEMPVNQAFGPPLQSFGTCE